jgi:hypothetical protein
MVECRETEWMVSAPVVSADSATRPAFSDPSPPSDDVQFVYVPDSNIIGATPIVVGCPADIDSVAPPSVLLKYL